MTSPAEAVILSKIKANGPSLSDLQSDIRALGAGGIPTTRMGGINFNFDIGLNVGSGESFREEPFSFFGPGAPGAGQSFPTKNIIALFHGFDTTDSTDNMRSAPGMFFDSNSLFIRRNSTSGSSTWFGQMIILNP